jgi:hypothetical protein
MSRHTRGILFSVLLSAIALPVRAGTAMFQASFVIHGWGNDITSGASYPYNEDLFTAVPLGCDVRDFTSYTTNGPPTYYLCGSSTARAGNPATGSGVLDTGVMSPASIVLPQSAFGITTSAVRPIYCDSCQLQSTTYATFANAAGTFFAGGGPARSGTVTKTGMGQTTGSWVIRPRPGGFTLGGVLGLMGRYGAVGRYTWLGATYEGSSSWALIPPMGRPRYSTIIGYTPMGSKTLWANPYAKTDTWVNKANGNTSVLQARGTGTLWTTGAVAVYARAGIFPTILHRTGFDTTSMRTTSMGTTTLRNIQLVTPVLVHWIGPGFQTHTGHIGILTLRVPEPGRVALLTAGMGALALPRRASRRKGDVV